MNADEEKDEREYSRGEIGIVGAGFPARRLARFEKQSAATQVDGETPALTMANLFAAAKSSLRVLA